MRFASLPRLSHYDLLCVCLFTIRNSEDIDTFVLASSRDSDGITCLAGRCHEMSLRTIERSRHSHSTGSIRLECIIIESTFPTIGHSLCGSTKKAVASTIASSCIRVMSPFLQLVTASSVLSTSLSIEIYTGSCISLPALEGQA